MSQKPEVVRVIPENWHFGRHFSTTKIEDTCPCPQESCGLVNVDRADPKCEDHSLSATKTMRQGHTQDRCPGNRRIS